MRKHRMVNQQFDGWSCGFIAIANTLKWFGVRATFKEVKNFCDKTDLCIPGLGMWRHHMVAALKLLKVRNKKINNFSVERMEKHLNEGGSLMLIYDTFLPGSHVVFIDRMTDCQYRAYNNQRGGSPWIKKRHIRTAIRRSLRRPGHLCAFLFAKPSE